MIGSVVPFSSSYDKSLNSSSLKERCDVDPVSEPEPVEAVEPLCLEYIRGILVGVRGVPG